MSDVPFHMTKMGRQFYDHTMPELVRQLERLNELLNRLVSQHDQGDPGSTPAAS
jgi:hypothetical protein